MDALNDQGLATGDSEEVKENCLAGNESVATAQKRTTAGNSSPPIADQGASKRALGDSLPAGCYDDPGELDYDESMEGDREQLAPAGIQTSGCVPEEVEEGEVTSDEEGEIKDDDGDDGASRVPVTKKGDPLKAWKMPSLKADHVESGNKKWGTEESRKGEDLTINAEMVHPAVCRHFIQGKCSWGRGCRFLHHDNTEGLHTQRDFPFNHGHFGPHFPADVAALPDYLPPLGGGGLPHRAFPQPLGLDPMCPPFLPVPEPLPPTLYRDPDLLYHGSGGPRTKWGGPFQEGGKLKTSDVEEESEGWHRLRTVTRRWDSDGGSAHGDHNDRSKHKKEQNDSDSGAEMDSSPERAKDTTPSSKSEAWTDPWARQGPSGQTREKKRRDISHRGDTPVELAPRKRRSPKGIETPLQQGVQAEEAKGVKEEQAVKEKRKTLEEKKADIKEGKADIKEGKGLRRSPGQDKEGERQSRKRGLSTSPDVASDDSASDAEERKTAPKKRGRKEWRTSSRGGTLAKKLSGGSPASGGDCVDNESRKTDIPRPSSTPPHQLESEQRGRGRPSHYDRPRDSRRPIRSPPGRKKHAPTGGGAWGSEVSVTPRRGSSGDEVRSPTPAPSDSISSESDSAPEDHRGGGASKQLGDNAHRSKQVGGATTLKPKSDEDTKSESIRKAKLLEELNAINREIQKKKTQATRM